MVLSSPFKTELLRLLYFLDDYGKKFDLAVVAEWSKTTRRECLTKTQTGQISFTSMLYIHNSLSSIHFLCFIGGNS